MNGWIKLEKSLESDPRVLRMARAIEARNATPLLGSNAGAYRGVTLVIGALSRLWMLADSHADCDDFLGLTADELNDWIGVPGFCELMPECWLIVEEDGVVKLPRFQEHNGTKAKAKAQTAMRQAKHRDKVKRKSVTVRNAGALPDQDQDQDQDQDLDQDHKNKIAQKRATQLPEGFAPQEAHKALARDLGISLDVELPKFTDYHRAKGSTMKDWDAALRTWIRNARQFAKPEKLNAINRDFKKIDYRRGVNADDSF